jgi:hypothetical protein
MTFATTGARRAALFLSLCAAAFAAPAAAQESNWSFSTGADYTNGDYGSGQDTEIFIVPFTAAYGQDRWRASVTVPYVSIEGAAGVVPGSTGATGGPLSPITNPLLGTGGDAGSSIVTPGVDEEGLGDVTLELAVTPFISEGGARVSFAGAARLPTGDEARSLGAGETVLSVSAGVAQPIGERAAIYGALGYAASTESGEDSIFFGAGVEGRVSDTVLIGLSADWSQARVADAPERSQATLYSGFDLSQNLRLAAYVSAGLTDAAPDVGGGLRFVWH